MRAARRTSLEMLTGAVIFVLLVVFLTWAYTVAPQLGSGYQLTARFDQVDGLSVGSEVRLAGIQVGTVASQVYDPTTKQAVVTLTLQSGVQLPDDTSASVISDGLLGGKYLRLSAGGSLDMLTDGDQIAYVQGSIILERILERIIRRAEARRNREP